MTTDLEKRVGQKKDGFKSEGERRIGEFLDSYGIRYRYEQGVLVEDKGKPKIWHPDYFLPEFGIYLEYFGLAGEPDYDRGIKRKKKIYSEMGLEVISVYPWHFCDDWRGYILDNIEGIQNKRLKTFSEKRYGNPRRPLSYSRVFRGKQMGYSARGGRGYR